MIRPAEYWQAQEAVPGNYVFMEFPELEASGLAKVKSLEPCPAIADGSGNIVTARIVTRRVSELIEIEVAGGETLTGTPMHPIWSVERQGWVELGELEVGEHLSTEGGPVEIVATRLLTTGESVYNLEVHGHHIYRVTELGLLVHNSNLSDYRIPNKVTGSELAATRKAFAKVKPQAWMDEAATNASKYTSAQLERMKKGLAPLGDDGFPMEIHHRVPLAEGGSNAFGNFDFLTRTLHRLGENYKRNHPNLP